MTGIYFYLSYGNPTRFYRKNAEKISHRGNLESITHETESQFLQVFINAAQSDNNVLRIDPTTFSILDGQIYNADKLNYLSQNINEPLGTNINEILFNGYQREGEKFYQNLQGEFTHIGIEENKVFCARDPIGFNPLYYIHNKNHLVLCSELKGLEDIPGTPKILQPGSCMEFTTAGVNAKQFFDVEITMENQGREKDLSLEELKRGLFIRLDNYVSQIMNENDNVASLLSGGVDSTVICALAQQYKKDLDVYTVAAEKSPDLKFAQAFSEKYPEVNHVICTIEEKDVARIIPDVIYALETFDAALIRSAIPMFLLCSKINSDTEILLTGEGADELFGGYHYLKDMSQKETIDELIEMLKTEHALGLQRVDRIIYNFGIEPKAPWFDTSIFEFSFQVPMKYKIREIDEHTYEKWIVHETFKEIIPEEVYLRKKAKFSRGVGSQFYMRDYCDKMISDEEFEKGKAKNPQIVLRSKEEYYYWKIFQDKFRVNSEFLRELPLTSQFIL